MFERFNQRKRLDFEQMKKNFNINFIEAFKQIKQSFFKRQNRSFKKESRESRENNKYEARDKTRNET